MMSTHPNATRLSIARLLLASALAFATSVGGAVETDLKGCVVQMQPMSLSQLTGASQVGVSHDVGNVTIMDINGDYDRGLTVPRQEVATKFYASHPDKYYFLVVFTNFEFPTGEATAFYNPVQNDTHGIGKPLFDDSAFFGSNGQLQGLIDMAALSRYAFTPRDLGNQKGLMVLAHEMMHRWVASVHFVDRHGQDSADLLGQEGAHWNFFLDSDASVMYGNDWQKQDDGKFHSVDVDHRYSSLDLYLAGFAAPSEVAPFTLIRNGDGGVATDYPKLGAISAGQAETVTIDQVIAASGERLPSAEQAQRDFTGAIILLKRPGQTISPKQMLQLEQFRIRFQQQFAQMTDGRGNARFFTQQRTDAEVATPETLVGSGGTDSPSGTSAAVAWLESRQLEDGHWEDRPATALRDTVAVIAALAELDPDFSGLDTARTWLAAHPAANTDQRAWRLFGTGLGGDANALALRQDDAGGFALRAGWNPSPYDTGLVASALTYQKSSPSSLSKALQFLSTQQNTDGSLGFTTGGRGRVLSTLRAATLSRDTEYSSLGQGAADWISAQQRADGGLGLGDHSSLADTIEVYAMLGRLPLQPLVITGLRNFVRTNQQRDGDWGGSAYLTATAALAYGHDQSPNLVVVGKTSASPNPAQDGAIVALQATISNTGNVPAGATIAHWYDGDPDQGGLQIDDDIPVPALAAGASISIMQNWGTRDQQGDHDLWLVLDVDHVVSESSEQDNRSSIAVSVLAPSSQAELLLSKEDFSLDPTSVTELPSQVQLAGLLRNIGAQDAVGVVMRLVEAGESEQVLAETTLNVPARSSVPVSLVITASEPKTLNLRVRADPDQLIDEANNDNNETSLVLPYGQSLDLEVTASDLVQVQTPVLLGHDVDFDLTLRNRGTTDAPPTALQVVVVQAGTTTNLMDSDVQIPAGQAISHRVTWRAGEVGPAQLHVTLDPDTQLAEANEDNNSASLDLTVLAQDQADLTFVTDSLAFSPLPALQGQVFTGSVGVRNLSSIATPDFRVALYAADPRTGAPALGSTVVPSLNGTSSTTALIEVADLGLSGDQTLYAKIDVDNVITETDENNNVIVKPLHILPLSDVAVSVADVQLTPALPVPGEPVQAFVTVRNLGGQDAHGVLVRTLEGSPETGVPVGSDQSIDELPAGGIVTLDWSWILGVSSGARAVSVVADPGGLVREGSKNNNTASIPFDVQNSSFFASERYISPNDDGVRDASVVVFRMDEPGNVYVEIVNGAQYTVRHFTDVALNGSLRGQVLWDGRDDRGRIVPDGDYHIAAFDSDSRAHGSTVVTVDNNHSSFLEAYDTPYAVITKLQDKYHFRNIIVPPVSSPFNQHVFGFWRPSYNGAYGLYRVDPLTLARVPVISIAWIKAFGQSHDAPGAAIRDFAFSPEGRSLVARLSGNGKTWILKTGAGYSDSPQVLAVIQGDYYQQALGYFDSTNIVVGPDANEQLLQIDTSSGDISVIRAFNSTRPWTEIRVLPAGVLLFAEDSHYYSMPEVFLPRDPSHPELIFRTIVGYGYYDDSPYNAEVSPWGTSVAIYERTDDVEKVDLVQLATGARKTVTQGLTQLAFGPETGGSIGATRFGIAWIEASRELLVQDAIDKSLVTYSDSGNKKSLVQFHVFDRVGDYVSADSGSPGAHFDPSNVLQSVPHRIFDDSDCKHLLGSTIGAGRRFYDPTTDQMYVRFDEKIGAEFSGEGWMLSFIGGVHSLFSVDATTGSVASIQKGTHMPLLSSADKARYPWREFCGDDPPGDWPLLILADGARLQADGRVTTLSRGTLAPDWSGNGSISKIWADEGKALLGDRKVFNSLLNLTAVLQARTVGRGIELSGIAADRNFAYYKLDWALISQPNDWHVLTPASQDQVFIDEFMTWVPSLPGTFLIRLTVVDKAGNATKTTSSASSFDSSVIDRFALTSRHFSPNGDGIKDQLGIGFTVLQPATLELRIADDEGNTIRTVDQTYGASELGSTELVWDGRDDGGAMMHDGRYRINLARIIHEQIEQKPSLW